MVVVNTRGHTTKLDDVLVAAFLKLTLQIVAMSNRYGMKIYKFDTNLLRFNTWVVENNWEWSKEEGFSEHPPGITLVVEDEIIAVCERHCRKFLRYTGLTA